MKSIKGEVHRNPQIGEVVIVRDDALPRGKWKVAKILKLLESEVDGVARAVKLRLPSGRITQRPLRMIYPLECDNGVEKRTTLFKDDCGNNKTSATLEKTKPDTDTNRPLRTTAIAARKRIRMQCNDIS